MITMVEIPDAPDHDRLNPFRKRFLAEIEALMLQVRMIARTLGVLHLGHSQIGDGQKTGDLFSRA